VGEGRETIFSFLAWELSEAVSTICGLQEGCLPQALNKMSWGSEQGTNAKQYEIHPDVLDILPAELLVGVQGRLCLKSLFGL